jgi:benzylsuccinate CoA-transferase BbsE subunit|tara:strand:- start:6142 stop:7437 length:1296 start_codon:yes stop_codon:yes gene_type:complete
MTNNSPLNDVTILDATASIGHYAGKLLADLGANVIKIESLEGDESRKFSPYLPNVDKLENSLQFLLLNANKKSIAIDLYSQKGQAIFEKLIMKADILLESWTHHEKEKMQLSHNKIMEFNSDLIHGSITGWGLSGPKANWAYADIVGVAMSGVMNLSGFLDGPPENLPDQQGYHCASIHAASGVLTGLLSRELHNSGGQLIEVSMQESLSIAQEISMQNWDIRQFIPQRTGESSQVNPMNLPGFGLYECKEGMVYIMTTGTAGAGFAGLVEMMDKHNMAGDLKETSNWEFIQTQMNGANLRNLLTDDDKKDETRIFLDHLEDLVTKFMLSESAKYIYEYGQANRVLVGIISTPEDISQDNHLKEREWFQEIKDIKRGVTLRYPGFPYNLSLNPPSLRSAAPILGEHTEEILKTISVNQEEYKALQKEGIIL